MRTRGGRREETTLDPRGPLSPRSLSHPRAGGRKPGRHRAALPAASPGRVLTAAAGAPALGKRHLRAPVSPTVTLDVSCEGPGLSFLLSEGQTTRMLSLLYRRGPLNGEVSAVDDIQTKGTRFRLSDLGTVTKNPHEEGDIYKES